MIFRRKPKGKILHKQHIQIPPLQYLGEIEESQLELTLQEKKINFSIKKTVTFNSSSANRQSLKIDPGQNLSLNTTTPNSVQQQILYYSSFQETNKNNEEPIIHRKQQYQQSEFKRNGEIQKDGIDIFARSLSNYSRAQRVSQRRDSDTNTKKSILKLYPQQQCIIKIRGQVSNSSKYKQIFDDTQSQKTSKSQKRVKFDTKIFRPKNIHFLQ